MDSKKIEMEKVKNMIFFKFYLQKLIILNLNRVISSLLKINKMNFKN